MSDLENLAIVFGYWCEQPLEVIAKAVAKSKKKKHDPKAHLRNRGKVVFPAGSSKVKDDKDHFELNTESQARAALSYAGHYSKAPPWYKGTLEELKSAIRRAVKRHYPSIDVSEPKKKSKKSSLEILVEKYS